MIGEPYRWQCEADRCYRQRDRAGRWHAHGRDMGTDDPGAGNRYHPECRPARPYRLRRVVGGDYESEYEVIDRGTGSRLGWVGRDRPGHWIAESPGGIILAEIDIDTRADAIGIVLHPERAGAPMA